MTTEEKIRVRNYALKKWEPENSRNPIICRDGSVHVTVDYASWTIGRAQGRRRDHGRILVGYADEILREIEALDEYRRLDALDRKRR